MTPKNQKPVSGHDGHRERLRKRFLEQPESINDSDLIELLLTFSIPRRDVASLAQQLWEHFGSVEELLLATAQDLAKFPGVGDSTITLLKAISAIMTKASGKNNQQNTTSIQPELFSGDDLVIPENQSEKIRLFVNDEAENSLKFLPFVRDFSDLSGFRQYLLQNLPYNSIETRQRRADYIISRFFPSDAQFRSLKTILDDFPNQEFLKNVIFYTLLKAEPMAAKVAEDFIFPSLPLGKVEREQLKEYLLHNFPEKTENSLSRVGFAVFHTYDVMGIGSVRENQLRIQLHKGDLESFLYILTSEFPKPGIYSYEMLFNSPIHRWLLWDKDWIRSQLFNLRDIGIISKIGEIETLKQFTLEMNQPDAFSHYFQQMNQKPPALREKGEESAS